MPFATLWDIEGAKISTDHRMPTCTIKKYDAPYTGKGRWTMPLNILKDTGFLSTLDSISLVVHQQMKSCVTRTTDRNPQTIGEN